MAQNDIGIDLGTTTIIIAQEGTGVVLTGGGAQLHGLPEYLSQELKVNVEVSPDPVNCVALGTAMSLSVRDRLETGFTDATPRIGRR